MPISRQERGHSLLSVSTCPSLDKGQNHNYSKKLGLSTRSYYRSRSGMLKQNSKSQRNPSGDGGQPTQASPPGPTNAFPQMPTPFH